MATGSNGSIPDAWGGACQNSADTSDKPVPSTNARQVLHGRPWTASSTMRRCACSPTSRYWTMLSGTSSVEVASRSGLIPLQPNTDMSPGRDVANMGQGADDRPLEYDLRHECEGTPPAATASCWPPAMAPDDCFGSRACLPLSRTFPKRI